MSVMARKPTVVWHGTPEEAEALTAALSRNCECDYETTGQRVKTCPGHDALAHDQRFVDGLIFGRRASVTLEAEEWMRTE